MTHWAKTLLGPRTRYPRLTVEEELSIDRDPILRHRTDPFFQNLRFLSRHSDDAEFHEQLRGEITQTFRLANSECDPFLVNLPPSGTLPTLSPGRAPLAFLKNGQVLSLPLGKGGTALHFILVGKTGSSKTALLIYALWAFSGRCVIVALDPKGDLSDLARLEQKGDVVVLDAQDLRLSMSDGLGFMSRESHVAQWVDIFASSLHLRAASRLLTNVMYNLLRREPSAGLSLPRLIQELERIDAARTSQLGGHRDALLFSLQALLNRTGDILTASRSDFMERLIARPRTFIINTGGLSPSHASLLAHLIIRYVYEKRRALKQSEPPVLFVLDDALELVSGSRQSEAEGRVNPISHYVTISRSLNVGIFVSAQCFNVLSPTLKQNCDTIVTTGSFGEDAAAVARFMGLNKEQAAVLPTLRPGHVVALASKQWPHAVRGRVPEVV